MMKKILLIVSFCVALISQAQSSKWTDLFSYNNVKFIREDGVGLVAATENGIFYYNPTSGEIKKLSKANGLHDVKVSAFDYDPASQRGIVGYFDGSMDVITPNAVYAIVDIPLATSYNGDKKINNISITGDKAVISTGYGVSIFNVSTREFGDTAFFVTGGAYLTANAAVIKDNTVYVATDSGIKTHDMDTTFPVFSSWNTLTSISGIFKKIDYKDILVAAGSNQVFYGTPNSMNLLSTFNPLQDMKIVNNNIVIADNTKAYIYSETGSLQKTFDAEEQINTAYLYNNQVYTGTQLSGLYNEQKNSLKPDGPYNNLSYKISILNNNIWISSGRRDSYNVPNPSELGYYHYNGSSWIYPEYFKQVTNINVLDVIPNPSNPSEIFFTNYTYSNSKGIYKMTNDQLTKQYLTNDPQAFFNRPVGCVFDESNNLICSAAFMDNSAKTGFYYLDKTTDQFVSKILNVEQRAQKPVVKNGILYISMPLGGQIIYDYNNTLTNSSDDVFKSLTTNNNLPSNNCFSVAVDKNEDVWIGTDDGLRILSNPKSAILEDSPQTDNIIIEQAGLGEELFRDAAILQITVDSGNQKWVSIDGGGVFYLSSDGQQTIYNFTKLNSPLPNNTVTDIQVDEQTGKVYFVTEDGVVAYQGDVTGVTSNFGNVLVYPNPVVYAQYKGNVRIRGLAQKTNIRITDAAGNLIHSAVATGGYYEWNLQNQRGVRVASGIYYVLMTNEDGTDTATAKIAVVN